MNILWNAKDWEETAEGAIISIRQMCLVYRLQRKNERGETRAHFLAENRKRT
jgi:hypothetical protein